MASILSLIPLVDVSFLKRGLVKAVTDFGGHIISFLYLYFLHSVLGDQDSLARFIGLVMAYKIHVCIQHPNPSPVEIG